MYVSARVRQMPNRSYVEENIASKKGRYTYKKFLILKEYVCVCI